MKSWRLHHLCLAVILAVGLGGFLSMPWSALGVKAAPGGIGNLAPVAVDALQGLRYQWHTFYGMTDYINEFHSVATDSAGNVYLAGYADHTWGSPKHAYAGGYDIVVMKLDKDGHYLWHTFYGTPYSSSSNYDDVANGVAVDTDGNVYVTGYSDSGWLGDGMVTPKHNHDAAGEDMFVLKLDTNGNYLWHTFYQNGRADAIALDSQGAFYIAGDSAVEMASPQHTTGGVGDIAILRFTPAGALDWFTYYGGGSGAESETVSAITVDSYDSVYVTGASPYNWLGDLNGIPGTPPLHPHSPTTGYVSEIYALKVDSAGDYQWHTFYGSSDYDDTASGIAVSGNNVYVTGESGDTWGSPLHALTPTEHDIAVLKLTTSGSFAWNTFYGSPANDGGLGVTADASGNAYVLAYSNDTWSGPQGQAPVHAYSGHLASNITVLMLNANGVYQRHTFYGATDGQETPTGIAMNARHWIYVTGTSTASWLGDNNANPLQAYSGNIDRESFVLKLSDEFFHTYVPQVLK